MQQTGIRVVKEYYPDGRLKSETEALGKLRQGESREYRRDGTLENRISYDKNRKHGPAYNYYPDGKTLKTEIHYYKGYKNGEARWYYPDGKIYRITPYEMGRINGIRKVYYENGKLQAEVPYSVGRPGVGLREYYSGGAPKQQNVRIVFRESDRVSLDNTFRLLISLSDGGRNVKFYRGRLIGDKYWNEDLKPIPTENGTGVLSFDIPRGSYKMETIHVVARIRTALGNDLIIRKDYHLAVENNY